MSADEGEGVVRIATAFVSIDQLVAQAATVIDGDRIAIAAQPAGGRRRFQIVLASGAVALEGAGEVDAAGTALRIVEIDPASKPVYARITNARAARRPAPAPFRKVPDVARVAAEPAKLPPAPPAPAPPPPAPPPIEELAVAAPVVIAAPTLPPPPDEATAWVVRATWTPPAWLRSRRAQIAFAVTGVILLIGIIAAFSADDAPAPPSTTSALASAHAVPPREVATPDAAPVAEDDDAPDAGVAEPEPVAEDDTAPPPPPPAHHHTAATSHHHDAPPPTRTAARTAPAQHTSSGKQVRLTVHADPPDASVRVDGEGLDGGSIQVAAGSTVTVTATKRGYRRLTRSVAVGHGTSITIKLQHM